MLLDMEQQLQANSIRIKVLEQENTTLHASLVKLRERAQNNATRVGRLNICDVVKCRNVSFDVYYSAATCWFCGCMLKLHFYQ